MTDGNYPETIPTPMEDVGAKHLALTVLPTEGGHWTVELTDLEQYQPHPRRKALSVKVRDVASLIAYTKRMHEVGTLGYADTNGGIKVVINDNEPSRTEQDLDGEAGWRDHTVTMEREKTTAYTAWKSGDGTALSQTRFAEFLEDRIGEIIDPPGADLFELAKFFTASNKIGFSSARNLSNGQVQLAYTEEIEGNGGKAGNIAVPTEFKVLLRPYKDSPVPVEGQPDKYQFVVVAKLRWRLKESRVEFSYHFGEELQTHLDAIHNEDIERVERECAITVLRGA